MSSRALPLSQQRSSKVKMPPCSYGLACKRKGCAYTHPDPSTKQQVNEDVVCLPFLSNNCMYGNKCYNKHVGEEEKSVLLAKLSAKQCRFGKHCRTYNCLYAHPTENEPEKQTQAKKDSTEIDFAARLAAQEAKKAAYDQMLREQQSKFAAMGVSGSGLGTNGGSSAYSQHQHQLQQQTYQQRYGQFQQQMPQYRQSYPLDQQQQQQQQLYQQREYSYDHHQEQQRQEDIMYSQPYPPQQQRGSRQTWAASSENMESSFDAVPKIPSNTVLPNPVLPNPGEIVLGDGFPNGKGSTFLSAGQNLNGQQQRGLSAVRDQAALWNNSNEIVAAPPAPFLKPDEPTPAQAASTVLSSNVPEQNGRTSPGKLSMAERLKLSAANPAPSLPSTTGTASRVIGSVRIPQELWMDASRRNPKVFDIKDPMTRFFECNKAHNKAGVLDMHFQTSQTVPLVLDTVLSNCKCFKRAEDGGAGGYVWIITGSGHHTQQRLYKLLDCVKDYLDERGYSYKHGKDVNGHLGAFYVKLDR